MVYRLHTFARSVLCLAAGTFAGWSQLISVPVWAVQPLAVRPLTAKPLAAKPLSAVLLTAQPAPESSLLSRSLANTLRLSAAESDTGPSAATHRADIANYSDGVLSLDYPVTWEIQVVDNGVTLEHVTDVAREAISTQVAQIAAPPGPVVNANIDSFLEEGAAVRRYSTVTVDGQSALRIWLAERPDETLSAAIATFIGYGSETILLFSRYAPDNTAAEPDILQLHNSFSHLSPSPANTRSDSEEVTPMPNAEGAESPHRAPDSGR